MWIHLEVKMNWYCAQRLPLDVDLAPLVTFLRQQKVPCWVSEEQGMQVVWLQSEADYGQFQEALLALQASELQVAHPAEIVPRQAKLPLKRYSVTLSLLLLGLFGAILVALDTRLSWVHWLTFTEVAIRGNALYFSDLATVLALGQWWRLVSPMILHFGLFHVLFNSLWVWEMGRRIETKRSGRLLLLLSLFTSITANVLQYLMSGPALFGGMSGVLYGYVGYILVWQRLWPARGFGLGAGIIGFMLLWLVLCFTGVVDGFIDGQVANGAHLGGLIGGVLFAALEMLKHKWFAVYAQK
jgi:GlpG protein